MKCSFCSEELRPGTGTMYVKKDGKILYFCSMKCRKNLLKLKRKPRLVRWTGEFRAEKEAGKKPLKSKISDGAQTNKGVLA